MGEVLSMAALLGGAISVCILWWILAVRGMRRAFDGTIAPALGTLPAQLLLIGALIWALLEGPIFGLLALIFPAINAMVIFAPAVTPGAFLRDIAPIPLAIAGGTLALTLALRITRAFALILTTVAGLTSGVILGEARSHAAMCATAAERGLTDIRRNTLGWSLRNARQEVQLDIHAIAQSGDGRYGWSYGEMDWYLIPDHAFGDVDTTRPACPA